MKGSSALEQLRFLTYELRQGKEKAAGDKLSKATTAESAADIVSRYYERPKEQESESRLRQMEATKLGAGSPTNVVTINPTTNINVTGTGADATAKAVAREQTRVYGDTVRNARGLLR